MPEEQNNITSILQDGVNANNTNSPQLSIDPASDRVAIIGDPNEIKPTDGTYKLSFRFQEDEVSESDKAKMVKDETTGEYCYSVTYEHKRVKPLYREKITLIVIDLFEKLGVISENGYSIENLKPNPGSVLVDNIEEIATIAQLTCGIPKDQIENLDPTGLAEFISQFLVNEPNILKEAVVFLVQQSKLRQKPVQPEATTPQNTPQS